MFSCFFPVGLQPRNYPRELTYPTLGKGKSSTQNAIFWGYVSSLEGIQLTRKNELTLDSPQVGQPTQFISHMSHFLQVRAAWVGSHPPKLPGNQGTTFLEPGGNFYTCIKARLIGESSYSWLVSRQPTPNVPSQKKRELVKGLLKVAFP